MRYWVQYHNYDALGYLPGGIATDAADLSTVDTSDLEVSCTTTGKKEVWNTVGDVVFLVLGYGERPKKYLLWSWCVVEFIEVGGEEGQFDAYGTGRVLNPPPPLTGPDYEQFRKRMANYSLGFRDISTDPFLPQLVSMAQAHGEFSLSGAYAAAVQSLPEQVLRPVGLSEGCLREVVVDAYERSPEARRLCIEHYGTSCSVCGFSFGAAYGPAAEGLIHVHHLTPLSDIRARYAVDPVEDLRPVCPNCHAAIHHGGECRSIEEVKKMLAAAKSG